MTTLIDSEIGKGLRRHGGRGGDEMKGCLPLTSQLEKPRQRRRLQARPHLRLQGPAAREGYWQNTSS
jgi:hypothetical protein